MQIVILAAGRGTRMGDLTVDTPKPMLEINGKPLLAYKIEALPEEIDEVIFVIGYLRNQIQQYFGDSYAGKKISYVVQEKLNGTGGAVHLVKNFIDDDFLVMMGDDLYLKEDIQSLMKHDIAILGKEVDDPSKYAIIKTNSNGNVIDIIEKPQISERSLTNVGIYKLNKDFFNYELVVGTNGELWLPQTIVKMKDKYEIAVEKASNWFPVGNPEDLKKAQKVIDKFI